MFNLHLLSKQHYDIILCRFVNMALPRSVKELSKLDFLPRHCESEHFRGFSFIGEDFPLPERNVRSMSRRSTLLHILCSHPTSFVDSVYGAGSLLEQL